MIHMPIHARGLSDARRDQRQAQVHHSIRAPRQSAAAMLAAGVLATLAAGMLAMSPLPAVQDDAKPAMGTNDKTDDKTNDKTAQRAAEQAAKKAAQERAKWQAKLDAQDKAATSFAIGFAAPDFPADAERIGLHAPDMASLRGKVVLIQTFTTKTGSGLAAVREARKALEDARLPADDVAFIAVHTPENAEKAKNEIGKAELDKTGHNKAGDNGTDDDEIDNGKSTPDNPAAEKSGGKDASAATAAVPVGFLLDSSGAFCDALGAYKKPIAILVDRQGNVRYAGLTKLGITGAAKELAAEAFDASTPPTKRGDAKVAADDTVAFPVFTDAPGSGNDLRGKPSPPLAAERWWNGEPYTAGRLVIVDFWATWCKPCRDMIPHMNDIATALPNDVAVLGISSESWREFEQGTLERRINKSDFRYAVGVDSRARMQSAFAVTGIPFVAAISSDGIVRWQGHPAALTPDVVNRLVAANRALLSKSAPPAEAMNRWSRTKR